MVIAGVVLVGYGDPIIVEKKNRKDDKDSKDS